MMNLFGVPVSDDVAAAFLAAAANKRQEEAKKAFKPDSPFGKKESQDVENKAKKSADTAKKFFDAYMAQGFTRAEAFKLTVGNLNTKF
ncbi:hypothetical protein D7X87_22815 [bacterium D16-54]|nr:hypothetical protein D7X87_22815 [bacterium D16-54]RKJ10530.1 hypothetical protein D7X65_23215 [bacterium D16-56]